VIALHTGKEKFNLFQYDCSHLLDFYLIVWQPHRSRDLAKKYFASYVEIHLYFELENCDLNINAEGHESFPCVTV